MHGKNVWVIEDTKEMLSLFKDFLSTLGYQVSAFANGKEAVERLGNLGTHHDVGVVLSDVCMSPVNGLEVIREVNKIDPHLPVVLMSSLPAEDTQKEAMVVPFSYLQKPFPLTNLAAVVESALKRNGGEKDIQ
jgi:DNA-binding NtrC family response regulator